MSIEKLNQIFNNLDTCEAWSLQLLKIKISKKEGTHYLGREITLKPDGYLNNFITKEIANKYIGKNGIINKVADVIYYDGSTNSNLIYKISINDNLIKTEYSRLKESISKPNSEIEISETSFQAYILSGKIEFDEEEYPIKLVSMKNPITSLKHKFLGKEDVFKEINNDVLSLKETIDVIILGDIVYMFNISGERLFNMERAYKKVCKEKIDIIGKYDIMTDFEAFSAIAKSGHNPRKFVSFNDEYLESLKDIKKRKIVADKFKIRMDKDKFDTSSDEVSDKLIKLLCNKGMVDPFNNNPMEVSSSRNWI